MGFKRTSDFAYRRGDVKVWGMIFIKKEDFAKSKKEPVDFYEVLCNELGGCI